MKRLWEISLFAKNQYLSDIEELDRLEENHELVGDDRVRRGELRVELERLLEMEEIAWLQKSRVKWLKKGDRCTQFFHKVANSNRHNNLITILEVDGVTYQNPNDIGTHMVSFN